MKRGVICILLALLVGTVCFAFGEGEGNPRAEEYLRIHVRANSNSEEEQAIKYEVKDAIVCYLTPVVAACESKAEAIQAVRSHLQGAEQTAMKILSDRGHGYGVRASLRREQFPTRVYDGVTLEGGEYDALVIELGSGQGDNWWCVVYPPLCFTGGNGNVVYKSKIAEIIQKFFAK